MITSQNNKEKIIVDLKIDIRPYKVRVIVSPTVYDFHDPRRELVLKVLLPTLLLTHYVISDKTLVTPKFITSASRAV